MKRPKNDKPKEVVESPLPPSWDKKTLLEVGYKYDASTGFYYRDFEFRFKNIKRSK